MVYLNFLDIPEIPLHYLQLKIGSLIILLRHLNPPRLCNISVWSSKATISTGKFKGEIVQNQNLKDFNFCLVWLSQ